eukprot:1196373-Prorocentrum_minimum.AAC.10
MDSSSSSSCSRDARRGSVSKRKIKRESSRKLPTKEELEKQLALAANGPKDDPMIPKYIPNAFARA